ncbi:ribonuclease YeeF family protein [Bacillus altitudinis]|uniref:ribonuclease YeeF family protein n=1 Tax=Bacillus altitudinis TaxID=293387 RepID=UPI0038011AEC|nr:T7SS effector LXG polymorphic toxin [Bacillus altitudinis]MCY7594973.1 T7SS effector LXG polymorphic toxin [Bacillus altitudinis]
MDARAKHYQELREQMVDLKKALQGVANLGDDFTGKGADNIKSFYKELAGNVDMFISFIDKQKAFHDGVSGTLDDTSFGGDTFVEEHFLDHAVHMGIKNAKSIVKDQKKALKTIFEDIDDLISLEVFDSKSFDEKIADAEDERKKTVKDLIELDQNLKDEYALSETEEKATMALYAEMMSATNDGKSISPMNFDKKAFQDSEIYKAKSDIEKQTAEYLKIKKEQEEAREIAKEQEALANRSWYEKALDYGGNIVNELTGVNDAKRAATGVDPITGEELTAGQRVAAGGMAAAGYIPIVGWAGRIFKGGKAVYKTTQATSAAVRAVDIYKTSQKSFDALKTSQKGLYGLTSTNGFSEAITGRDMFGNKISKEQQEVSMNAALGMLLPFGAKGFHGKMGIKGIDDAFLTNKGNLYRGDSLLHSPTRPNGIGKPHISSSGDLVPASKEGLYKGREVTVTEHILGGYRKEAKSNSPYTSFTNNKNVIGNYGENAIELNISALRKDIQSGKLKDVVILSPKQIQKLIERDVVSSDFWKKRAINWTKRDNEYLIKGEVPSQYIKVSPKE